MLFGSSTYPPSHPFGNAEKYLKVKEQWGMQWSQRGSDDVMTNQWVTKDICLVSENRDRLAWVSW